MPKLAWNITDFSGGVNKLANERDILDTESSSLDNLISHHSGSIKKAGYLLPISNSKSMNIITNPDKILGTYLQPSSHFVKHFPATLSVSSGTGTLTDSSLDLSINTTFQIVKTENNSSALQKTYTIISNNGSGVHTFNYQNTSDTISSQAVIIVVGATVSSSATSSTSSSLYTPHSNPDLNKLMLINNGQGQFGYWNINEGYFLGSNSQTPNNLSYKWLFSTQHTWDFNQINQYTRIDPTEVTSDNQESINTLESFHIDGVVRVIEEAPLTWHHGFCKRPVGYYYIEDHIKFGTVDANNNVTSDGIRYASSWYSLRSHCLSPGDYRHTIGYDSTGFNQCAGQLTHSNNHILANMTELVEPTNTHQVNICISGNTNVGLGDFQCASGSDYREIGLGMSFIYDDLDQDSPGNYSQQSTITKFTTDGNAPNGSNEKLTIANGVDNTSLLVGVKVNIANSQNPNNTNVLSSAGYDNPYTNIGNGSIVAINGENINTVETFNNYNTWNPRIVGANIWITSLAEELSEPVLLGTLNFYGNSDIYGLSKSHDGSLAEDWNSNGQSFKVEAAPIMDYHSYAGYHHKEQHQVWYKTSTIVNRKLYVGNIKYFESVNPLNMNHTDKLLSYPDKLLMSVAPNKFDIMPVSNALEIAKFDGQDIICLQNFNNELLVFKTNDLFTIDCSGEDEILKDTFRGKGIFSKNHTSESAAYVFFFNNNGMYAYDGETILELMINKISSSIWRNLYSDNNVLSYDNENGLLIMTTDYDINRNRKTNDTYLLIYNIGLDSLFFKSETSTHHISYLSKGMSVDNKLYFVSGALKTSHGLGTMTLTTTQTSTFTPLKKSEIIFRFQLESGGTWLGTAGGTAQVGSMNNKCKFLKIRQENAAGDSGDTWITLNLSEFTAPDTLYNSFGTYEVGGVQYIGLDLNIQRSRDNIISTLTNFMHNDYELISCERFGEVWTAALIITIRAKQGGSQYNLSSATQNLVPLGAPYSTYSGLNVDESGATLSRWAFAAANGEGTGAATDGGVNDINTILQNDGTHSSQAPNVHAIEQSGGNNIQKLDGEVLGTNLVNPVHTVTIDNDSDSVGPGLKMRIRIKAFFTNPDDDGDDVYVSNQTQHANYETGVNYWDEDEDYYSSYIDETTLSAKADINNAIASNFAAAINDQKILQYGNALIKTATASSAVITITVDGDFISNKIEWYNAQNASTECTPSITLNPLISTQDDVGRLMYWDNDAISVSNTKGFLYETKDIDFNEPGIRKKIYKAHITYTGGNGNIACYYQADQSGTWVAATTFNSTGGAPTNAGFLNNSTTQTKAEITFGTGGNNKHSFALKFEGGEQSTNFEINDISIVYRLKSPK